MPRAPGATISTTDLVAEESRPAAARENWSSPTSTLACPTLTSRSFSPSSAASRWPPFTTTGITSLRRKCQNISSQSKQSSGREEVKELPMSFSRGDPMPSRRWSSTTASPSTAVPWTSRWRRPSCPQSRPWSGLEPPQGWVLVVAPIAGGKILNLIHFNTVYVLAHIRAPLETSLAEGVSKWCNNNVVASWTES